MCDFRIIFFKKRKIPSKNHLKQLRNIILIFIINVRFRRWLLVTEVIQEMKFLQYLHVILRNTKADDKRERERESCDLMNSFKGCYDSDAVWIIIVWSQCIIHPAATMYRLFWTIQCLFEIDTYAFWLWHNWFWSIDMF